MGVALAALALTARPSLGWLMAAGLASYVMMPPLLFAPVPVSRASRVARVLTVNLSWSWRGARVAALQRSVALRCSRARCPRFCCVQSMASAAGSAGSAGQALLARLLPSWALSGSGAADVVSSAGSLWAAFTSPSLSWLWGAAAGALLVVVLARLPVPPE
jgi:hypothetical protein